MYIHSRRFDSRFAAFRWVLEDEVSIALGGFGTAVDFDGDRFVVGLGSLARAYVYLFDGAAWNLEDSIVPLLPESASNEFGGGVAIDGSLVLIGDRGADFNEAGSGAAFLFEREGSQWVQLLNFGDSGGQMADGFGNGVALQGDTLVAGADGQGAEGAVFVFEPPVVFEITSGPTGTPNPVASGGVVSLSVDGEDSLGNPASSFSWRASCSSPLEPTTCSHDLCSLGPPLVSGCDACVSIICEIDAFCCNNAWDMTCIERVTSDCVSPLCIGLFSDITVATPTWTAPTVEGPNPRRCQITASAGNGVDLFDNERFTQTINPIPEPSRTAGMLVALASVALLANRRPLTCTGKRATQPAS